MVRSHGSTIVEKHYPHVERTRLVAASPKTLPVGPDRKPVGTFSMERSTPDVAQTSVLFIAEGTATAFTGSAGPPLFLHHRASLEEYAISDPDTPMGRSGSYDPKLPCEAGGLNFRELQNSP
jgi:hypothetical protein